MAKNTRGSKEFSREQRLSKENKQLKKELSHLRKQIARLDGDRFETLRQMCQDSEESNRFQENMGSSSSNIETLKKDWACRKCTPGYLEIMLYPKLNQTWYYRKCNSCNNRTTGQRYDSGSVKGIIKEPTKNE